MLLLHPIHLVLRFGHVAFPPSVLPPEHRVSKSRRQHGSHQIHPVFGRLQLRALHGGGALLSPTGLPSLDGGGGVA